MTAVHRTEQYDLAGPDGTIHTVWHDIDTGATRVLGTRPGPRPIEPAIVDTPTMAGNREARTDWGRMEQSVHRLDAER